MEKTVSYFEQIKPDSVDAAHCTDLAAKCALSRVTSVVEGGVYTVRQWI
ncbi:hypothetical protein [Megasphaera cerevisiae]|jgi:7,8-dihydropterin-6-yl-methyl-4-(beta-D-ribofuranosyl)aminobenzene 5'-phosphate synthase|nr:hypothetical protein [Megasphaera cerevisiae]